MSGHRYISSSGGLFDDEVDVDDETFLRNARPRQPLSAPLGTDPLAALDAQRQTLMERKQAIEQRTLDSSSRSVGILRDSEKIGIATAEELLRQREQLENSSKRLDEINANLRFSQKHINGIKSVFSSLKNYISGKNETPPKITPSSSDAQPSENRFTDILEQRPNQSLFDDHPSARLRGIDAGSQRDQGQSSGSKKMNELLEANLDEMVTSITRLKGLAINLGEEIESQNDLIDDIHDKVEGADSTITRQNKQMNRILGK